MNGPLSVSHVAVVARTAVVARACRDVQARPVAQLGMSDAASAAIPLQRDHGFVVELVQAIRPTCGRTVRLASAAGPLRRDQGDGVINEKLVRGIRPTRRRAVRRASHSQDRCLQILRGLPSLGFDLQQQVGDRGVHADGWTRGGALSILGGDVVELHKLHGWVEGLRFQCLPALRGHVGKDPAPQGGEVVGDRGAAEVAAGGHLLVVALQARVRVFGQLPHVVGIPTDGGELG
mmetsp:Transcript_23383/g.79205  ORF Transcript_23383/g.79205 Transcript_23383/m.79205 type:complete len:234 (-) Transcript_23383:290-991(-)